MRALYFDCFAGVSGDMIVAALLDLGLERDLLVRRLSSLGLDGFEALTTRVDRCGIAAARFEVELKGGAQPPRRLGDIRKIVERTALSDLVKTRSIEVFERLADAEARVHGCSPDEVHFHEVGAVDSIVDIVGAMIGFEALGIARFLSSPLRVGRGSVDSAHGRLPVPAPGTAELLRGVPVYGGDEEGEFVTPTGAAVVTTLCEWFGSFPRMTVDSIGYGAGSRNPDGFPNVLRLVLGEIAENDLPEIPPDAPSMRAAPARVMVVETNIDDMSPQVYGHVMERAYALGAVDGFLTPVQMKKGRPGTLLTLLCEPDRLEPLIDLLLKETTTLGVRYYRAERRVLARSIETVQTSYGRVRIKVALEEGRTIHFQPEYEDCARIADEAGVPLVEVQSAARAAYERVRLAEHPDPAERKENGER